jgi:hypothetical protein
VDNILGRIFQGRTGRICNRDWVISNDDNNLQANEDVLDVDGHRDMGEMKGSL